MHAYNKESKLETEPIKTTKLIKTFYKRRV